VFACAHPNNAPPVSRPYLPMLVVAQATWRYTNNFRRKSSCVTSKSLLQLVFYCVLLQDFVRAFSNTQNVFSIEVNATSMPQCIKR